ncbi:DUF488 family protein, partial [Lactobacillus sp. XV13L]|nr:DUF488 family protein [Lactobacillus sp. XV13L]
MTKIKLVRIYDHEQPAGYRILVDRLWPRGKSKASAALDLWAKDVGPSSALRKWFNHDDQKFAAFARQYQEELAQNPAVPDLIALVRTKLRDRDVLFLYGAKNRDHNRAVVLK